VDCTLADLRSTDFGSSPVSDRARAFQPLAVLRSAMYDYPLGLERDRFQNAHDRFWRSSYWFRSVHHGAPRLQM